MAKRKSLRRFSKKSFSRRKPLRKAGSKLIRRIARQEVRRQIEDKEQRFNAEGFFYNFPGTGNWTNNNIFDVNATIGNSVAQGIGQGGRIGNKIRVTRFNVKWRFWCYTPTYLQNVYVKCWILSDKQNPSTTTVTELSNAAANGPWFNNGSSTTGMTQKVYDTMMPIDQDRWRVHKSRMWKLGVSTNPQGVLGYGNNDFKYSAALNINLSRYMPKMLQFRDTDTTVMSRNTYIVFQVVKADNTIEATNLPMIGWSRVSELRFEDA